MSPTSAAIKNEGIDSTCSARRIDCGGETDPSRAVFTDRGVYRLAEEVHFKAVLRRDTPSGIQLLPAGTPIHVTVRDSQSKEPRRGR
ncbi:MAG: hypothetical protein U0Q12_01160 [Vicinamibacterales bacterium]